MDVGLTLEVSEYFWNEQIVSSDMSAQDQHEIMAIRALGFLAADEDRFERFLSLSGMTPETVGKAAASKQFLKGVLEHILGDESLLLVFCSDTNIQPEEIYPAARGLEMTPRLDN